jgi:hypothetical protein
MPLFLHFYLFIFLYRIHYKFIMLSGYRNIEYRTGELDTLLDSGDYGGFNAQKAIGCPPLVKGTWQ